MLNKIDNGLESSNCLVLLHGFGADENDLFDLKSLFPGTHVISYRAPIDLSSFGYPGGRAWFPLDFTPYGIQYNDDEIKKAITIVTEDVYKLRSLYEKLYICGFSQGAILTHALLLNNEVPLDGIAALSGRFNESIFKDELKANIENKDVFLSHGKVDEVIPIESGRQIFSYYESSKANVFSKEYFMGHGIDPECQMDLKTWYSKLS